MLTMEVGDLGNNKAAISIQQTEAYPDYRIVEEQVQTLEMSLHFRIENTKEVMSLLDNQKRIKLNHIL